VDDAITAFDSAANCELRAASLSVSPAQVAWKLNWFRGVNGTHTNEDAMLVFARNFFRNPKMLGSVIPSSRYLVSQLLRDVDWSEARVIVELGPGVGTITREVLKRMRPDAVLLAFEINDEFVRHLSNNIADPRLRVQHRSGAEVVDALAELQLGKADYVIAGIPFSIMSENDRSTVLLNCRAALHERGVMLVYQFSGRVGRDLTRLFARVRRIFEPRNIPPARVFHCYKQ
jgi:phospholipid N-methyltransferase